MSPLVSGRRIDSFVTVCFMALALAGCGGEAKAPEQVAAFSTADVAAHRPVVFELPQVAGRALLVRVQGFETEFESKISDNNGKPTSTARLPYIRHSPVFHVIDTQTDSPRKRITLDPRHVTNRSELSIAVFELPADSRWELARIEAYRAYEAAIQATDDESPDVWQERAEWLESAAAGFKRSGDDQARLWAEYLRAHIHYFPLARYDGAIRMARDIQGQAAALGFRGIVLASTQLEGQALIERREGDEPNDARDKANRGQEVLQRAVALAAQQNYRFEQAWALNTRGIGYFYQDRYEEAEQFYSRALDLALDLGDPAFESLVRGNLALVQERQGDFYGALAELRAINARLLDEGSDANLAHNWSELSRLYERLYLFPESIEAQGKALDIWRTLNSAEGKGRSGLSLAHAYQAIGNPERALSVLTAAIADMEAAGFSRGLRDGFGVLARLYRRLGQFDRMATARERQGGLLSSDRHRATFLYEQGIDALTEFPDDRPRANALFSQAEAAAMAAGDDGLAVRARLQWCAIADQAGAACAPSSLRAALEEVLAVATPSQSIEARFLFAQILARLGAADEAWAATEALVDDIQLFRQRLPGVLGAWYWEGRVRIFEFYMALALDESRGAPERAVHSLLAFNRLLNTSLGGENRVLAKGDGGAAATASLRSMLASLGQGDSTEGREVRQAIDRQLLQLRAEMQGIQPSLGASELKALLAGLPDDAGVLAFYLESSKTWAWLATSDGIRMLALEGTKESAQAIERARTGLQVVGNTRLDEQLGALGEVLLAPLGPELPETIFLLSAGPLAGFPFEAVRIQGRYLGQDHVVINVLSLEALGRAGQSDGRARDWQKFLLAGDPRQPGSRFSALPSASSELDGLSDLLAGKVVTSAREDSLDAGLFRLPAFAAADVVHIASHARINLEYPELSRLMVSGPGDQAAFLTPLSLRDVLLDADLVVLSACETSGVSAFSFDSNLGFVPAFLQSGAGAVVATLWPVADAFAAEFVLQFYAAMLEGKNVPAALAQVKRRHIAQSTAGEKPDWPAFQLYRN